MPEATPTPPAATVPETPPVSMPPVTATPPPVAPAVTQPAQHYESDERFFGALGYFGPLFILSIIAKPKSEYCKFHARQSMVLFLITFVVLIVLASVPWIGSLFTLALFAGYVLAIFRAYKGELWSIPVVSVFASKINLDTLYKQAGAAVVGVSTAAQGVGTTMTEKATQAVQQVTTQEEQKPEAK